MARFPRLVKLRHRLGERVRQPARRRPRDERRLKRHSRLLLDVALGLLALTAVTAAVLGLVAQLSFTRVASGSMEPWAQRGDLLVLRPEPAAEVRPGQVLALPMPRSGGQVYTHRVVSAHLHAKALVLRTRGDANPAVDPWTLRLRPGEPSVVVARVPMAWLPDVMLPRSVLLVLTLLALVLAVSPRRRRSRPGEAPSA